MPQLSIDQLKRQVDREITDRGSNRKLSTIELHSCRNQYNRISLAEKSSRSSATGLDALTANTIVTDLNKLMTRVKEKGSK